MTAVQTLLRATLGAIISLSAGAAFAADIETEADCLAAEGMTSKIEGALTCTLPIMPAEFSTAEEPINQCSGELINGGTFCQVIIDQAYKDAAPDCDAVEDAKANPEGGYEAWLAQTQKPYSDAWKCEKLKLAN